MGTPVELYSMLWVAPQKIKKKTERASGSHHGVAQQKKEKEKKKEFRSARAQWRDPAEFDAERGRSKAFCATIESQAAHARTKHAAEKAAGKRTRPAFGRAVGRPAPVLCRCARFSADSAISRQRRASGPIAADRRTRIRFGPDIRRPEMSGRPPLSPPLTPPGPGPRAPSRDSAPRVPIGSWRDAAVRARATRGRPREFFSRLEFRARTNRKKRTRECAGGAAAARGGSGG